MKKPLSKAIKKIKINQKLKRYSKVYEANKINLKMEKLQIKTKKYSFVLAIK